MSQREAFLKAILANPESDAPRLVYADWLEEQGDSYGEFIRTQILLANRPSIHEVHELESREEKLRLINQEEWAGKEIISLMTVGERFSDRFVWRRGFIEEITLPFSAWSYGSSGKYICEKCGSIGEHFDRQTRQRRCDCCRSDFVAKSRGVSESIIALHPIREVTLTHMPEIRFSEWRRHVQDRHEYREQRITYSWDTFVSGVREPFAVEFFVSKRDLALHSGNIDYFTGYFQEQVARAMTPLGYCKAKWPSIKTWTMPSRPIDGTGTVFVELGGTVSVGDFLEFRSDGRAVIAHGDSLTVAQESGLSGERILVMVLPYPASIN